MAGRNVILTVLDPAQDRAIACPRAFSLPPQSACPVLRVVPISVTLVARPAFALNAFPTAEALALATTALAPSPGTAIRSGIASTTGSADRQGTYADFSPGQPPRMALALWPAALS